VVSFNEKLRELLPVGLTSLEKVLDHLNKSEPLQELPHRRLAGSSSFLLEMEPEIEVGITVSVPHLCVGITVSVPHLCEAVFSPLHSNCAEGDHHECFDESSHHKLNNPSKKFRIMSETCVKFTPRPNLKTCDNTFMHNTQNFREIDDTP